MKKRLLTTLILFVTFLSSTKVFSQINAQDSLALIDLYESTDGQHWNNHTNWLTESPVGTWFGVNVSDNRVVEISLPGNHLIGGQVPSSIENLTRLKILDLHENVFNGSIPVSIGNLSKLKYLDLNQSGLSDTIPSSIGNLTNLTYLNISNCQLTGNIPSSIGNLTELHLLDLSYNHLSGNIPANLGNLKELQNLSLEDNNLSGNIPSSLGNLQHLQFLDIGFNSLRDTIPFSLGNLLNLQTLGLYNNNLIGSIPPSLGNLLNLAFLDLDYNQLSGNIPATLGNLLMLDHLRLEHNNLTGNVPASIAKIPTLKYFGLSNNLLSGIFPSINKLPNLTYLLIDNNKFTFAGMETVAKKNIQYKTYAPQANIVISKQENLLSVSAGGTLGNDTFRWYKNGILTATIVGDSTYTVTSGGVYSVVVTNFIATQLTLYSDTISLTILPLNWSSFTAIKNKESVLLNWNTCNEINNKGFYIQRSNTINNWKDIGYVSSKGVDKGCNDYFFTDTKPLTGYNLYRIKQVDNDGKFSYSKSVNIVFTTSLKLFPNPINNILTITGLANDSSLLYIINAKGETVNKAQTSSDEFNWNVQNLSAGNYFLVVLQNDKIIASIKFIKQ